MISRDGTVPLLLVACPSYGARWIDYSSSGDFDPDLLYVHLGDFARHVVDLLERSDLSEFTALAGVVERLHVEGDPYVREAATVGLLEGIQNVAGHRAVSTAALEAVLHPETRRWWASLNAFWNTQTPHVGADIPRSG